MLRVLVPCLLIVVAACSRDPNESTPAPINQPVVPAPPSGTGGADIDMNGSWVMTEIVRLDSVPLLPNPMPGSEPFLPVRLGQQLVIADGAFRGAGGGRLFEPIVLGPDDWYRNEVDGSTALLQWFTRQSDPCPRQLAIEAVFGSNGPDGMLGFVTVMLLNGCPGGLFVLTNPNGSFLVRLQREVPAQPVSDR